MCAERAARQILAACRRGDAEIILSLPANLAAKVHRIACDCRAEYGGGNRQQVPPMGFLTGKDWSIIAITFERATLFRVNGNRKKGGGAVTIRDNAKRHARTIHWAVFDQNGKLLQSEAGPGVSLVTPAAAEKLARDLASNSTVQEVLEALRGKGGDKAARVLAWDGYPMQSQRSEDEAPAAAAPTTPSHVYTLLVAGEGGDELESTLRLTDEPGNLRGRLLAPDGSEVPIENASLAEGRLTFDVTLGAGDQAVSLRFSGRIAQNVVRGVFVE